MSTQELIDELEEESAAMCLNLTAPPEAATWTLERIRGYFESPESSPASESTAAVPGYLVEEMRIAEEAAAAACQIVTNYRSTLEVDTKRDGSAVTQADVEAEAAVLRLLKSSFPNDLFVSEEAFETVSKMPEAVGTRRV